MRIRRRLGEIEYPGSVMDAEIGFQPPVDETGFYPGDVMDTAIGAPERGDGYVKQPTADGGNIWYFDTGAVATVNRAGQVTGGNVPTATQTPTQSADTSLIGTVISYAGQLLRYEQRNVAGRTYAVPVPVRQPSLLSGNMPLILGGLLVAFALTK